MDIADRLLFVGSCFADNIGKRFAEEQFAATINPYGVMYNPVSVLHTVERLAEKGESYDVAFLTFGTNHIYILKETGEVFYYTKEWKSYRSWTEKLFKSREEAVKCLTKQYRGLRHLQCITDRDDNVVYIFAEMNRYVPHTNDYAMHINYAVFEIREVDILTNDQLIELADQIRKGFNDEN